MSVIRDEILNKALVCIDEASSASSELNAPFFPTETFLDEAARWVIRIAPQYTLGVGRELPADDFKPASDGSGTMPLPNDFVRLLRFRVKGWRRPVLIPIYDTDIRYQQQFNQALRGGDAKPVVVLCENARRLEYYSSSDGAYAKLQEARYFGFEAVHDDYPNRLIDITAWKTAEIVMATMNDATGMQFCTARVNELLQTL